jgi:hypothetical protein
MRDPVWGERFPCSIQNLVRVLAGKTFARWGQVTWPSRSRTGLAIRSSSQSSQGSEARVRVQPTEWRRLYWPCRQDVPVSRHRVPAFGLLMGGGGCLTAMKGPCVEYSALLRSWGDTSLRGSGERGTTEDKTVTGLLIEVNNLYLKKWTG